MSDDPRASDDSRDSEDDGRDEARDEVGQGGEAGSEDEDAPRPISVRDLMPSPPSRPSRRPPERTERPERAAEPEEEVGGPEEEGPPAEEGGVEEPAGAASVPTPVRVAMDAPPPGDSRPPEELPSRRFEVEGEEWIVRISGRTITGTRPDAGALLMHLSFFRGDDPEDLRRRLVTVDRPLDALYDEDLRELYARSRPAAGGGSGSE